MAVCYFESSNLVSDTFLSFNGRFTDCEEAPPVLVVKSCQEGRAAGTGPSLCSSTAWQQSSSTA